MAERRKIGIIFDNNPHWTGGTYYILNLISALHTLQDAGKPEIIIFTGSSKDFELVKATGYPYLSLYLFPENYTIKYSIVEKALNKIWRVLFKKNIIDQRPNASLVTSVFPYNNWTYPFQHYFELIPNKIAWIADFQEHFLPEFFSPKEIETRKSFQSKVVDQQLKVILSSQDSATTFRNIFQNAANKVFVIPFAVTHSDLKGILFEDMIHKFKITRKYFFAPNQFWKHKNHMVVLKAIESIKEHIPDILVVFSGKETDNRNPDYFSGLKKFVDENCIGENVKFLGFIDRKEQLCLMSNSLAVIQPSLFEGWSTVIEDAKALNKYIIASNLNVHKEQLVVNSKFFDPLNPLELATLMADKWENPPIIEVGKIHYKQSISVFGSKFIEVFN